MNENAERLEFATMTDGEREECRQVLSPTLPGGASSKRYENAPHSYIIFHWPGMKDTWERGRELIDRHGVTRSWHGRYLILDGWLLPGTQDSPEGREKSLVGRGQQDGTFRPAGRGVPARR